MAQLKENIPISINEYLHSWQGNGKKEVAFYGGSFTAIDHAIQKDLLLKVRPFLDHGLIDSVRISTRPDYITKEILLFLKEHGVKSVELGIQSLSDEVLIGSGRGHSAQESIDACKMVKDEGFLLGCQLMPGLPLDDENKAIETALQVSALNPDFVRIYPTLVIKDSALEKLYKEKKFESLTLDMAIEISAEMVKIFRENLIDVIRVGLQPTKELEESIVAGPYHPSFGELVESHLFFEKAKSFLRNRNFFEKRVVFTLSSKDESAFRGQKNKNIKRLQGLFPQLKIEIQKNDNLSRRSLTVN